MLQDFSTAADSLLAAFPDLWTVYLFGSFADGRQREDSDLDLAVIASGPIPLDALLEAKLELANQFEIDIDLVDLQSSPLTLVAQVLESGKILRNINPSGTAKIETALMSRYCNLNQERKEILEDIQKRGSVYAR